MVDFQPENVPLVSLPTLQFETLNQKTLNFELGRRPGTTGHDLVACPFLSQKANEKSPQNPPRPAILFCHKSQFRPPRQNDAQPTLGRFFRPCSLFRLFSLIFIHFLTDYRSAITGLLITGRRLSSGPSSNASTLEPLFLYSKEHISATGH